MDDTENSPAPDLPPDLRFLKLLTGTLTAVMIVGLITVVALLVTRLRAAPPLPALPDSVILPESATPAAVTFGRGWLVVVTDEGTILLYGAGGGAPVNTVPLP